MCGINYYGIAIGSWARRVVKPYINSPDFWDCLECQHQSIEKAKELVKASV